MQLTTEQIKATSEFMDKCWEDIIKYCVESGISEAVDELDKDNDITDLVECMENLKKYIANEREWYDTTVKIEDSYMHDLCSEFKKGFFTAIMLRDVIL